MVWWGFRWGAGLFICWDGKPLLSKSKATPKHMIIIDLKQVTGRRGHGRVHTNLASSTIQTYTYTYRILIYDKYMIIVQKMTKSTTNKCTIQTVDWWKQATKLSSHMKSVWALQAIKSQLRRWWPCKIYWTMVPRQSFHEQFSEIHIVSRETVEIMTTSIMEEVQIMQSLHLSKKAGALPFTKSLPEKETGGALPFTKSLPEKETGGALPFTKSLPEKETGGALPFTKSLPEKETGGALPFTKSLPEKETGGALPFTKSLPEKETGGALPFTKSLPEKETGGALPFTKSLPEKETGGALPFTKSLPS